MLVATTSVLPMADPPGSLLSRSLPVVGLSARISVALGVQLYCQLTNSARAWAPASRQRAMAAAYRRRWGCLMGKTPFSARWVRGHTEVHPERSGRAEATVTGGEGPQARVAYRPTPSGRIIGERWAAVNPENVHPLWRVGDREGNPCAVSPRTPSCYSALPRPRP